MLLLRTQMRNSDNSFLSNSENIKASEMLFVFRLLNTRIGDLNKIGLNLSQFSSVEFATFETKKILSTTRTISRRKWSPNLLIVIPLFSLVLKLRTKQLKFSKLPLCFGFQYQRPNLNLVGQLWEQIENIMHRESYSARQLQPHVHIIEG